MEFCFAQRRDLSWQLLGCQKKINLQLKILLLMKLERFWVPRLGWIRTGQVERFNERASLVNHYLIGPARCLTVSLTVSLMRKTFT